jgi:hypothetical protein
VTINYGWFYGGEGIDTVTVNNGMFDGCSTLWGPNIRSWALIRGNLPVRHAVITRGMAGVMWRDQ